VQVPDKGKGKEKDFEKTSVPSSGQILTTGDTTAVQRTMGPTGHSDTIDTPQLAIHGSSEEPNPSGRKKNPNLWTTQEVINHLPKNLDEATYRAFEGIFYRRRCFYLTHILEQNRRLQAMQCSSSIRTS
jgi:hypothetical protein